MPVAYLCMMYPVTELICCLKAPFFVHDNTYVGSKMPFLLISNKRGSGLGRVDTGFWLQSDIDTGQKISDTISIFLISVNWVGF